MTCHEAITGILVRANHEARRPTGLRIRLGRTTFLTEPCKNRWIYARLRVADIAAEDWTIVPYEPEQPAAANGAA